MWRRPRRWRPQLHPRRRHPRWRDSIRRRPIALLRVPWSWSTRWTSIRRRSEWRHAPRRRTHPWTKRSQPLRRVEAGRERPAHVVAWRHHSLCTSQRLRSGQVVQELLVVVPHIRLVLKARVVLLPNRRLPNRSGGQTSAVVFVKSQQADGAG